MSCLGIIVVDDLCMKKVFIGVKWVFVWLDESLVIRLVMKYQILMNSINAVIEA